MCCTFPGACLWRCGIQCGAGACGPVFRLFHATIFLYTILILTFQLVSLAVLAVSRDDLRTPTLKTIDSVTACLNGWSQEALKYASDTNAWPPVRLLMNMAMILISLCAALSSALRFVVIPAGLLDGKLDAGIYESTSNAWIVAVTQFILLIPAAAMRASSYVSGLMASFIGERFLPLLIDDEPMRVILSHVLTSLGGLILLIIFIGGWNALMSRVLIDPTSAARARRQKHQQDRHRKRHRRDENDSSDSNSGTESSSSDAEARRRRHSRSVRSSRRAHSTDGRVRYRGGDGGPHNNITESVPSASSAPNTEGVA